MLTLFQMSSYFYMYYSTYQLFDLKYRLYVTRIHLIKDLYIVHSRIH